MLNVARVARGSDFRSLWIYEGRRQCGGTYRASEASRAAYCSHCAETHVEGNSRKGGFVRGRLLLSPAARDLEKARRSVTSERVIRGAGKLL